MSNNGCQCAVCRCAVDTEITAAASMSAVSHNHRRLPGVLRYRGMENEAVTAARLVKVESLIATLRSALADLNASMAATVTPGIGSEDAADNRINGTWGYNAQRTAAARVHVSVERGGKHPSCEREQRSNAHLGGTKRDTNGHRRGTPDGSTPPRPARPNETVRDYAVSGIEPSLSEVLDDPSVRLLMARDGVTRGDLELLIRSMRQTSLGGQSSTRW